MPLPVIANTLRVAVEGRACNSHHFANILHFRKTAGLTFAGAIAILDPILLAHYNTDSGTGRAWRNKATTCGHIDDFRYTPLDGTSATSVINHALAGSLAQDQLPASQALVVTLRTAKRGRSYRGRVYQGPWNEAANDANGNPTSSDVSQVADQWNNFLTALSGSGVSLVVASYLHATAEDVVACTVDARWDTQRRRLNA